MSDIWITRIQVLRVSALEGAKRLAPAFLLELADAITTLRADLAAAIARAEAAESAMDAAECEGGNHWRFYARKWRESGARETAHRTEREAARAEVERLREALETARNELLWLGSPREHNGLVVGQIMKMECRAAKAAEAARAALGERQP